MCNGSRKCDLSSEHARRIYWYGGKVSRNEDFSSRSIDSGRWISGICGWIGARKSAERSLVRPRGKWFVQLSLAARPSHVLFSSSPTRDLDSVLCLVSSRKHRYRYYILLISYLTREQS